MTRISYAGQVLASALEAGPIVVIDNLGARKGDRARELIEGRGCEVLFLPPYLPDLDPIEEAFSKVKTRLRKDTHMREGRSRR